MRKDGVIRTFTTQIERVTDLQGKTLCFQFGTPGNTSRIDRDQVPDFPANKAWAEIQKISAKPWAFFKFVRFVDPPPF